MQGASSNNESSTDDDSRKEKDYKDNNRNLFIRSNSLKGNKSLKNIEVMKLNRQNMAFWNTSSKLEFLTTVLKWPSTQRNKETIANIAKIMQNTSFFENIKNSYGQQLFEKCCAALEMIFKQAGQMSSEFQRILEENFVFLLRTDGQDDSNLSSLQMINYEQNDASLSLSDRWYILLKKRTYSDMIVEHELSMRTKFSAFMKDKVGIFSDTPEHVLHELYPYIDERIFNRGNTVYKDGDLFDGLYIIFQGQFKVCLSIKEEKPMLKQGSLKEEGYENENERKLLGKSSMELVILPEGELFGEEELLIKSCVRKNTIICESNTGTLKFIPLKVFRRFFGQNKSVLNKLKSLASCRKVHRDERIESLSPTNSPRRKVKVKEELTLKTQRSSDKVIIKVRRAPSDPEPIKDSSYPYKRSIGNVLEILEKKRRNLEGDITENDSKYSAVINQTAINGNSFLAGNYYNNFKSRGFNQYDRFLPVNKQNFFEPSFLTSIDTTLNAGNNNMNFNSHGPHAVIIRKQYKPANKGNSRLEKEAAIEENDSKKDLFSRIAEMALNEPARKPKKKGRVNSSINLTNNTHDVSTFISEFENKSYQSSFGNFGNESMIGNKTDRIFSSTQNLKKPVGNFFCEMVKKNDERKDKLVENDSEANPQEWKRIKQELRREAGSYLGSKRGLKKRNRVDQILNTNDGEGHISSRNNNFNNEEVLSSYYLTSRASKQELNNIKDMEEKLIIKDKKSTPTYTLTSRRETIKRVKINLSQLGKKETSLEGRVNAQTEKVLDTARSRVRTELSEESVLKVERKPTVRECRIKKKIPLASGKYAEG